ncbi:MAG TPA: four-helix bundle copper-binding protein [Noviherbaspirillum sp.]|uniref:four-helix bundle copper-binding protein n=1 Tax=Noviherbaspirillum sp. TaxID=1926288 RepID=UPI002D4B02C1|nr:four-helix bundle copper-binding protein [Noviherbaspirillum sp.]HYD96966.1 four-helix bundle copper-binding protein [Noviherbaspirillum sp.]
MQSASMHPAMQQCVDECLHCYRTCLQMAMNHCLEAGGPHTEPEHFRLMMNCAGICRTSAEFMLSNSPLHTVTCAACAEVCQACADSCERTGDMDECVQACRSCMESCRRMVHGSGMHVGQMGTSGMQERLPM